MAIILPLVIVLLVLAIILALGAIAFAMSVSNVALQSIDAPSDTKKIKSILIIGGLIAFAIAWITVGSVDNDSFEGIFDYGFKVAICAMAAAIVLCIAAVIIKLVTYLNHRKHISIQEINQALINASVGGLIAGYAILAIIGSALNGDSSRSYGIAIHFDREPTHCIVGETKLLSAANRLAASTYIVTTLDVGEKVQLDPDVFFDRGERKMRAFRIFYSDDREQTVYAVPNFMKPLSETSVCASQN